MQIRYIGPSQSVEIAATGQTAERGKAVDVDDDVAKSLLKQDAWEAVTTSKKTPSKDKE